MRDLRPSRCGGEYNGRVRGRRPSQGVDGFKYIPTFFTHRHLNLVIVVPRFRLLALPRPCVSRCLVPFISLG